MRILHVHHFLDMGGSETVVLQLAREQRRMGHDVTICCMFGEGPLDSRAAEYGIPVVHLHSANKRIAKIMSLYRHLKLERYDVLHSHWAVWLATAVSGFLKRIPTVHTNHSNQPRRLFLEHRVACFFTTKVVVLTPYIEPYIAKWVAVPKRKLVLIPNGVDTSNLQTATRVEIEGISPESHVVGMVARLSPPKDYATFIQAAGLVAQTHPQVEFISVGNGQQREHFEREVTTLGLTNFRFLGGRMDVPRLLRRMTVNVLATKHEGQGLSLVEAMISGCASIGSDIPAVRFTLDEGRAGVLVAVQDPVALADAIIGLVDDPERRHQIAARGREYAAQFTVETMTQSYLDLYERITAKKSNTTIRH